MTRSPKAAFVVALLIAMAGCGSSPTADDESPESPKPAGLPEGSIVLKTDKGSTVKFDQFEVTCPDNSEDQWGQEARVVQAVAGAYGTDDHKRKDGIVLTAVDGLQGQYSLPHEETWGEYDTFVTVFGSRAAETRELSAATEGASGTIEIITASCAPTPSLELMIDGELVSETGVGTATVKGHIKLE
ncbi:MAG: hypothetical protein NTX33_00010 [Propionibacteriales bacterium]|nr:hypothetical protein [Propionibacteriales bacterium]